MGRSGGLLVAWKSPLSLAVLISHDTGAKGLCWFRILPCSTSRTELVEHVSWLIYMRRCVRGSRWRKSSCFKQALLVLAHLRKNETYRQVGAECGSEAAAWRYADEMTDLLAAWANGLHEALVGLGEGDFLIIDGTPIPTDRIKDDEPYYSQKHRKHRMNAQVIARPDGAPLWFSRATPGQTHDLTAAPAHGSIVQACLTRLILVLAGAGLSGRRRHRAHPLPPPPRTAQALPAVQS